MTYPIATVIYGCPYPQGHPEGERFEALMDTHFGEDALFALGDEEHSLWENDYSASPDMDPAGFFGEQLHCANGYWDLQPSWFQEPVPASVTARVDAAWAELPEPIRDALGHPRLAIAWSDS